MAEQPTVPDDEQADTADELPIEDLFSFDDDPVDFMSAASFPASDPPAPPVNQIGHP